MTVSDATTTEATRDAARNDIPKPYEPLRLQTTYARHFGHESMMRITAGPTMTIKSTGRTQNTVGKTIFNESFAAYSSTAC